MFDYAPSNLRMTDRMQYCLWIPGKLPGIHLYGKATGWRRQRAVNRVKRAARAAIEELSLPGFVGQANLHFDVYLLASYAPTDIFTIVRRLEWHQDALVDVGILADDCIGRVKQCCWKVHEVNAHPGVLITVTDTGMQVVRCDNCRCAGPARRPSGTG